MARPFLRTERGRAHDICAIGTALVDYLSYADRSVVEALELQHGAMTLIDVDHSRRIRSVVGDGHDIVSGGTVANTAAGVALLGGRPVNIGAVADDDLGARYEADLLALGVRVVLEHFGAEDGNATGTCHVIVTPEGERTLATSLGVSGLLGRESVDEAIIGSSALVYFDAYLLDFPNAEAIVERVIDAARRHRVRVALGLADPYAVERHREMLGTLVREADLVVCNEEEATAITGASNATDAIDALREGRAAVVTRGEHGALLGDAEEVVEVEARPVADVVDTTGAGDLFAAGVFYGVVNGFDARRCGLLGALCASEIVTHLGARPHASLAEMARANGLLAS